MKIRIDPLREASSVIATRLYIRTIERNVYLTSKYPTGPLNG